MTMYEQKIIELDEGWNFMQQKGITKLKRILEGWPEPQFNSEEYFTLYFTVYNMTTQKPPHDYAPQLYEKYREVFEEYINSTVLPSLREKHDEFLLRELVRRWVNHKVFVRWLSRFFHYLDRYFTERRSLPTLNEVGLTCFRDLVYEELKYKVRDAVIKLINQEREGEQIDRALLKNVLDIFVEIGMKQMKRYENDLEVNMLKGSAAYYSQQEQMKYYENDFEDDMLKDSADYYARKASNWIAADSCPDYMLKAEECLKKERDRVSHYLHSSSEQKLVEKVQNKLLVEYSTQLLEKEDSGCRVLLRDDKRMDLSRMYRLFHEIPKGLEPIAKIFEQHVTAEGTALVQQAKDEAGNARGSQEQVFVKQVIELHHKYKSHVNHCFRNDSLFDKALKEAIKVCCDKKTAELLASFCDNILRRREKLSEKDIEDTFGQIAKLVNYMSDKDFFAAFYSAKEDHGRIILSKLKQHCGRQFTSYMEGMFKDFTLAENQYDFKKFHRNGSNANLGIDLTVTVLTTRFWPTRFWSTFKSSNLILPAEMVKCTEVFKEFYETKLKKGGDFKKLCPKDPMTLVLTTGEIKTFRVKDPEDVKLKLAWIYSLGTCNIEGKFEANTIEMKVGTYQAATLLLFNDSDMLTYSEIKTKLNVADDDDDDDLVALLESLSCAEYKILIKEPNTKTDTSINCFMFNTKFTYKKKKITMPIPQMNEKKRKRVVEEINEDRRHHIDASIVRIMKSRRVLGYQQLVTECVEQLSAKFQPDRNAIKKRIEDLIDREYLERGNDDSNLFRYLPG